MQHHTLRHRITPKSLALKEKISLSLYHTA
ncbi:protein of unknown function [Nitrospira japonica]|uniref:Uncharacterized protein n=1 Tax=Nitrospira japonica TaxID=1325564 RepID=A0A1W1HZW8_9BACT|nr:protein of unknown function [Nitrospira japonica]